MVLVEAKQKKESESYSDDELFDEMAGKKKWAFSIIYDRYSPILYGLALKILQDKVLAQDVLQEVFLAIWEKADRYNKSRGNPAAWMTILCRNRCIDKLRSTESERMRTTGFNNDTSSSEKSPVSDSDPFDQTQRSLQRQQIVGALKTLPDEQRKLIEMAFFEGFTQSEIADQLRLPLGTVKTRIRLGVQKLHLLLSDNKSGQQS